MMGLSTFVLGTAFTVLPLVAAGLLAALVLLERHADPLTPASAGTGRGLGQARRQRRPGQGHRARRRA